MRIRTIKPEFWSHRKIGRLSFSTKCLAIGLLNLCDDEGYFEADSILIRSLLFPFSDRSLSIHGGLTELEAISYIEIRKNDEHDILVGKVLKFSEHQVVNRPSPSKLRDYYDSGRTHGGLTEDSLPERKGKEQGTGKGKERKLPLQSPNGDELPKDFEQFWDVYPRHDDMKSALQAWNRIKPRLDDVLTGIAKYKKSGRWTDKKFIPLPTTFLNKERYDDEL